MKNTYTTEEIKAVSAKLRALPTIDKHKRQHTKQETIELLAKDIQTLRHRGYTFDQVAAALRDAGIEITTSTLRNYLDRVRAKAGQTAAAKTPSNAASTPTDADSASTAPEAAASATIEA